MLAHKVNENARLFFFDVKYPEDYGLWYPTYDKDIEYLKSRILTYRSAHTVDMDMETSQYYEGAKTLVDVLDLFHCSGCVRDFENLTVMIQNIKEPEHFNHAEISFKMYTDMVIRTNSNTLEKRFGNFEISLIYTRETENPNGIFIIHGKNINTLCDFTIGTEFVSKMGLKGDHLSWLPEDAKCFPAGPILKYSENFPTYSMLMHMIGRAINNKLECIEITEEDEVSES